jgi:hypothetical protein
VEPRPLDRAWMPGLQRWLPGSWADTSIADKAVKSDNAAVDFYPWHQRIILLFPCPPAVLVSLEEFALKRWRRSLVASFRGYLIQLHGPHWFAKWTLLRAEGEVSGSQRGASNQWPLAKRRRVLGSETWGENKWGVPKTERTATPDHELLLDVSKGRLVLQQVLQSKWWEWSHGSALFFCLALERA